ncbi:hypothetical protein HPB52_014152 [Rhipicephalus sanguineus]|uniref:Nucleoporin Nup133/Nup155-like C-terminal domain-containing protein n=1 Tax=Rhipicephalus sanguineus TaxID=34632 RepID=A0A9D4SSU8_RHISA|nr:hypothetical protein HPB52_014152 [Rhipicephalus sanguineus]
MAFLEGSLHFGGVGPQLPLGTACGLLTSCGHYPGVVDLSLSLAKQVDPQGLALHFYQQGERPEDERGRQAYVARMECYKDSVSASVGGYIFADEGAVFHKELTDTAIISVCETDDTKEQGTSQREKTTNPRDMLDAFDTIWAFL